MHLTPKFFSRLIKSTCYSKHLGAKIFEFAWIHDFLCPLKVALEVLHDRVLGSLGRQLLMTSTQESLRLYLLEKMASKINRSSILGLKRPSFVKIISQFSSLESELSFDLKDSEINFDRAHSAGTFGNSAWNHYLELWEQFAIFQATTGKTSLRTSCLYIRYGKLDTKWRSRKTKSRKEKSSTTVDGEFDA